MENSEKTEVTKRNITMCLNGDLCGAPKKTFFINCKKEEVWFDPDPKEILYGDNHPLSYNNGWTFDLEEHFGGEGDGDSYWCVLSLSIDGEEDTYWKFEGYYQSYNGSEIDFEDPISVERGEKTITVWNKK